jgi:hypothetical protein
MKERGKVMYFFKNINTNILFVLVSLVQMITALTVSQVQSRKIKSNARTTKFIQLGFALFVFIISLGQTTVILKKIKSKKKSK